MYGIILHFNICIVVTGIRLFFQVIVRGHVSPKPLNRSLQGKNSPEWRHLSSVMHFLSAPPNPAHQAKGLES